MVTKDKFAFIDKYQIYIVLFILLSVILCYIGLFLQGMNLRDCLSYALVSLFIFFFGYIAGYYVLGFQAQNSMCSLKVFDFFCQIAIYFFGIVGLCFSIALPIMLIISKSIDISINPIPGVLGFVLAANRLRNKYVVEGSPRKAMFSKKNILK